MLVWFFLLWVVEDENDYCSIDLVGCGIWIFFFIFFIASLLLFFICFFSVYFIGVDCGCRGYMDLIGGFVREYRLYSVFVGSLGRYAE